MAFARINGIVLHHRVQGHEGAPAVVLVNALGTDARIWDDLVAQLGERYRLVTYDKRGHGLSDAPAGDYTIDQHVDDLAGLLDNLGIVRTALAGVSVGGMIGQRFALRHPERLSALILCATAPKLGDAAMWNDRIAAIETGDMAGIADAVMERWFTDVYRQGAPVELAEWRNMFMRMPVAGYAGTCATLRDTDLRDQVGRIGVQTLVMAGEKDVSTPVALVRELAVAISGARFEVVAGAGHIPFIEKPGAVAEPVLRFLREVGHG